MKELYHCTPSELDQQDENLLNLHFQMLQEEKKWEFIQQQREKQKAKSSIHKK